MRVVESLKSGVDLTHPRLDAKWIALFVAFAALIMVLILVAKWIVAQVSALPGLSMIPGVSTAPATAPSGQVGGWDY